MAQLLLGLGLTILGNVISNLITEVINKRSKKR